MTFGLAAWLVLAADIGDLIATEQYQKAYPMVRPKSTTGASWIGFLYEAELLDVVRFARVAEGLKKHKLCRLGFAAAAQRKPDLRAELLARALNCAQKGNEKEAIGLLAGQLLKGPHQDRALIALASLEAGKSAAKAIQKLVERCGSRWCQAKLLAMASKQADATMRKPIDLALVQSYSDLLAGRAALKRLRKAVKKRGDRQRLERFLPKAVLLGRAEKLLAAHANKDTLAAAKAALKLKPEAAELCQIHAISGRALRKMRQHKKAIKAYDAYIAAPCDDDAGPGVYYGRIYSQAVVDSSKLGPLVARAHKRFPKHRLSDDFLFFWAEDRQRKGKRKAAAKIYAELVAKHPDGDMAEEADWRQAWLAYRSGDLALAKQRLDAFLRRSPSAEVHATEHQLRARFWRARLEPADARRLGLLALVKEHPGTWQALLAATHLRGDPDLPAPLAGLKVAKEPLKPTPALLEDPRFTKAKALLTLELKEQALRLLEAIPVKPLSAADLLPLTQTLIEAGGSAEAVGRLRKAPALRGAPEKGSEAIWKLAFPTPYRALIVSQAKNNKIPPALLFGLIREESGFDAGVLSWAGAKGLTQCMPPTARMVAKRHKVRGYAWSKMDQPELNVRIGSLYLGGLLKRWKGVLPMAVGSYNAGPGAMNRMRKKNPSLALDLWVEEISIRQTREYVQRVLASAWTYAQLYPDLGGLNLKAMGIR